MGKRFLLYGHGGALNHGAEAIVKCTAKRIREKCPDAEIILSTHFKEQDLRFRMPVDGYCERDARYPGQSGAPAGTYDELSYRPTLDAITRDTVCLSIGGDNYCYPNWRKWAMIHKKALERGAKSVLWCASVEPAMINGEMLSALSSYPIISARESLSCGALKGMGLQNVVLCPDAAFLLEPKKTGLPQSFIERNTVAVNVSPLVVRREKENGAVLKNIKALIGFILSCTDMSVALIPHVTMPTDNDFSLLREMYHGIPQKDRVCLVSDRLDAAELKYVISSCRLGVFARTHAAIAAYSSCVPSVAIGYSAKAEGIARDLGVSDYVLPVGGFSGEDSLLRLFLRLMEDEAKVKTLLSEKLPAYRESALGEPVFSYIDSD